MQATYDFTDSVATCGHLAHYPIDLVEAAVDRVGLCPRDAEAQRLWMAKVAEKADYMAEDWAAMKRGEA